MPRFPHKYGQIHLHAGIVVFIFIFFYFIDGAVSWRNSWPTPLDADQDRYSSSINVITRDVTAYTVILQFLQTPAEDAKYKKNLFC